MWLALLDSSAFWTLLPTSVAQLYRIRLQPAQIKLAAAINALTAIPRMATASVNRTQTHLLELDRAVTSLSPKNRSAMRQKKHLAPFLALLCPLSPFKLAHTSVSI